MMVEAMGLLLNQVNQYIAHADGLGPGASDQVVMGNIAQVDQPEIGTALENHLVLTLVKIEEEHALRNGKVVASAGPNAIVYRNRPLHLNLFLMFTAYHRDYGTALRRLAQVLTFFQGKQKFTRANSPGALPETPIVDFSLAMDLLSLTFEEVNHLWGFLGAKQSPFALYRGRLVTLADMPVLDGGGIVQEIDLIGRGVTV